MKRKTILFISLLIFLLTIFYGTPLLTRNKTSTTASMLDLLNPFVKSSEVYLKTTNDYLAIYEDAVDGTTNYVYEGISINKLGSSRKLTYISFGKSLKPNKFLKLKIKGQNVREWEEVTKKELPKRVLTEIEEH